MHSVSGILNIINRIRKEESFCNHYLQAEDMTWKEKAAFSQKHSVNMLTFYIGRREYTIGFIIMIINGRLEGRSFSFRDGKRTTLSLIERDVKRAI